MTAIALLVSTAVMPVILEAGEAEHQHAQHEKQVTHGNNPLLEEMTILDRVFREVVSAVSLGDGKRVHAALEAMHGTMEKTHEGVHSGAVKIPGNTDRAAEFVTRDKEFHRNLELLAEAARTGDQKEMLSLTKKVLDGCVNCHQTFRKP
jgi:cytochrome c556